MKYKFIDDIFFVSITLKGIDSNDHKNSCMRTYMFYKNQWYFIGGGGIYYNVQEYHMKEFYNGTKRDIYKKWSETCRNTVEGYLDSYGYSIVSKGEILSQLKSEYRECRLKQILKNQEE